MLHLHTIPRNLTYLASPYTDNDPAVMKDRYIQVTKCAANLIQKGIRVYSPLTHSVPMVIHGDLPDEWDFWSSHDKAFIEHCNQMFVLTLPGWTKSKGVQAEIDYARPLGIKIFLIDKDSYSLSLYNYHNDYTEKGD
jgi:hypothetical protein